MNYPVVRFIRRRRMAIEIELEDYKLIISQLITLFLFNMLCESINPESDYKTYILPCLLALTCITFGYFFAAWFMMNKEPGNGFSFWYAYGPVVMTGLAILAKPNPDADLAGSCIMTIFHSVYYQAGALVGLYGDHMNFDLIMLKKTVMFPILTMLFFFMFGFLWVGNHTDTGFIFIYPFYLNTTLRVILCLGTWAELYFIVW